MVTESIPGSRDAGDLQAARKLLPHARMAARRHIKMREVASVEHELHQVADSMEDWESSQTVESLYLRALRGKKEVPGAEHTSTMNTVDNLGNLYFDQGKIEEAEKMYSRALRGKEEAWGSKHTSTLDTVYNLVHLYRYLGEAVPAKKMYKRAVYGYKDVEGDHGADSVYLRQQLPLLGGTNGEVDRGCQTLG
jgi:tetratricopeptide (TPR) repeat protein